MNTHQLIARRLADKRRIQQGATVTHAQRQAREAQRQAVAAEQQRVRVYQAQEQARKYQARQFVVAMYEASIWIQVLPILWAHVWLQSRTPSNVTHVDFGSWSRVGQSHRLVIVGDFQQLAVPA